MHYRLLFIVLVSLLFGSFSMNLIHYDACVRAEQDREFNDGFYPKIIEKLHTRLCELEE
jgi:hypothetical protein